MSSSSSSDDGSMLKFASVAIGGHEIESAAEKSHQATQLRNLKAAQRRAGGGGVLGLTGDRDSDGEGHHNLDASQIKVSDALHRRLDKKLLLHYSTSSSSSSDEEKLNDDDKIDDADDDNGGVCFFKSGPRVTHAIVKHAPPLPTKTSNENNDTKTGSRRIKRRRVSPSSSDNEDLIAKRCALAAVDASDITKHAEHAALLSKEAIAAVDPGSEDEGGKAKQRAKRKRKILEERAKNKVEEGKISGIATATMPISKIDEVNVLNSSHGDVKKKKKEKKEKEKDKKKKKKKGKM